LIRNKKMASVGGIECDGSLRFDRNVFAGQVMSPELRRRELLRRTALWCAALMLAVTSLSAFIRLSQAGLGCDQWPQCYGNRLREAQREAETVIADSSAVVVARMTHRVLASAALMLALLTVVLSFCERPWLTERCISAVAISLLAVGLAILGRWSSGARLPAIAVCNVLGGVSMLALSWRLAATPTGTVRPMLRIGAGIGVLAILTQIALGALTSSAYAGLSCSSLGDCVRAADAAGWPWQMLNPWREPIFQATTTPMNTDASLVQLVHRGGALLVTLVIAPLALTALRGPTSRQGVALLALLVLQVGLGMLMAGKLLPLPAVLAHNILAALLLAVSVRMI
jgi:heme a synthase